MARRKTDSISCASTTNRYDRVTEIEHMMRSCTWIRGKSNREFAVKHGLAVTTVNDYASIASRNLSVPKTERDQLAAQWYAQLQEKKREYSEAGIWKAFNQIFRLEGEALGIIGKYLRTADGPKPLPADVIEQFREPEGDLASVLERALADPGAGLQAILERHGWYRVVEAKR